MGRDIARISFIRIGADGAPVCLDLSRFLSTQVGSDLDPPPLPRERGGPVLGKEPVVRVLALFLANNVGLQLGWKLAGKISSVGENGARLRFAGDCPLIRIKELLGVLIEGNGNVVHRIIQEITIHPSRLVDFDDSFLGRSELRSARCVHMPNIFGEFRPVQRGQKGLHVEVVWHIDDNVIFDFSFRIEFLKKRDRGRQAAVWHLSLFIRDEWFD
jgi:hypothetical protein